MPASQALKKKPSRYREIDVCGSPRAMGRQIGEAAKEEIRGFCDISLEHVRRTIPISPQRALEVARRSAEHAQQYSPDMMDELRGTAEAARVSIDDLMLLQVRNQLQSDSDTGCTAVSIAADAKQGCGSVVAQNWDADPALDAFTIVLTRRPDNKPALMTCTQAGLIAYPGFNEAGIGACVNTLPAPIRGIGVPHYFTLRGIYESTSLEAAVAAVEKAQRAIPVNIMLATPEGPADLEVTIEQVRVLRAEQRNWITHTNHCLHPQLAMYNDQFPELIQSHGRMQRIERQLASIDRLSLAALQKCLMDHENYPRSICRHANDDPEFGFWETVFSIIVEPDERRLHVSRGTPCDHAFEMYCM